MTTTARQALLCRAVWWLLSLLLLAEIVGMVVMLGRAL